MEIWRIPQGRYLDIILYQKFLPYMFFSIQELPELKRGYIRIYHGTNRDNAAKILKEGLLTGAEIKKRGKRFQEDLPVVMGTVKPQTRQSSFGEIVVVVDIPRKDADVSGEWVEIRRNIHPREIVGLMPGHPAPTDIDILIPAMMAHEKAIMSALKLGKPIPAKVMKNYPELSRSYTRRL